MVGRRATWGLGLLVLTIAIRVKAGALFDLRWSTVDGGGQSSSTGGVYSLGATAGQPDAGILSGGAYQVAGGFWSATTDVLLPTATPSGPTPTRTPGVVQVPAPGTGGALPYLVSAILGGLWLAAAPRAGRQR